MTGVVSRRKPVTMSLYHRVEDPFGNREGIWKPGSEISIHSGSLESGWTNTSHSHFWHNRCMSTNNSPPKLPLQSLYLPTALGLLTAFLLKSCTVLPSVPGREGRKHLPSCFCQNSFRRSAIKPCSPDYYFLAAISKWPSINLIKIQGNYSCDLLLIKKRADSRALAHSNMYITMKSLDLQEWNRKISEYQLNHYPRHLPSHVFCFRPPLLKMQTWRKSHSCTQESFGFAR